MKHTGIVRRLDELGRVVIPIEYRKMHRINVGDPMEIQSTENGEIIIRKIGLESEFISNARDVIESAELPFTLIVSDHLRWRIGVGSSKNAYLDNAVDARMLAVMSSRKPYGDKIENQYIHIEPIMGTDVLGLLMAVSSRPLTEHEVSTVRLLGKLISRLTDKY